MTKQTASGRVTNLLHNARGWVGRDHQGEQITDAIADIVESGKVANALIAKAEGRS